MIKTKDLSKEYKVHIKDPGLMGSLRSLFFRKWKITHALKKINLTINKGEIIGVLGANGAGKTTLVKSLSGIIFPTSGSAEVMGYVPWKRENNFRRRISLVMGQKAQLWWDLPAADCFLLLQKIYNISDDLYKQRLEELANILEIGEQLKIPIRRLSLGERMKMELVAALLHQPEIVFLDEPTIGLDIQSQRSIRKFILNYQKRYSPIIILTSHYMDDIKALCERVIIMRNGEIVFDGNLSDIQNSYSHFKSIIVQSTNGESFENFNIPEKFGTIVKQVEGEIFIKVPKEDANESVHYLLNLNKDLDIKIEEQPIEDLIDSIQRGKPIG